MMKVERAMRAEETGIETTGMVGRTWSVRTDGKCACNRASAARSSGVGGGAAYATSCADDDDDNDAARFGDGGLEAGVGGAGTAYAAAQASPG